MPPIAPMTNFVLLKVWQKYILWEKLYDYMTRQNFSFFHVSETHEIIWSESWIKLRSSHYIFQIQDLSLRRISDENVKRTKVDWTFLIHIICNIYLTQGVIEYEVLWDFNVSIIIFTFEVLNTFSKILMNNCRSQIQTFKLKISNF